MEKINYLMGSSKVASRLALRVFFWGCIFSIAVLAILVPIQRKKVEREAVYQAEALGEAVYAMYKAVDNQGEKVEAGKLLLKVARVPDVVYVAVLSSSGEIIFSNKTSLIGQKRELFSGSKNYKNLLLVNHLLKGMSSEIAAVQVAIDINLITKELNLVHIQLALGFLLVIFLLTILVSFIMERLVGRRLSKLCDAMGNAERGSFLVRAQVDYLDEVGKAARGFNKLLSALTNMQVREIEREQDLQDVQEKLTIKEKFEKLASELTRTNDNLAKGMKAQALLMEAAHELGGTLKKADIVTRLIYMLKDKLVWNHFAIFLAREVKDKNSNKKQVLFLENALGSPDVDMVHSVEFDFGEGITGVSAEKGEPILVPDLSQESRIKLREAVEDKDNMPDFLTSGTLLAVPMLYQGNVIGVMDFFSPRLNAFGKDEIDLLKALGAQAAMALKNADLYEATARMAVSDPLTEIMNRRAMEVRIESEIARSQRFGTPLSLLMVDIDYFKVYNDNMGHVLGDTALKKISRSLEQSIRKVDGLARFGGEEFCVILPQTHENAAKEVAEKLLKVVSKIKLQGAERQPLGRMSVSIGVAEYPDDMPSVVERTPATELVHAADSALYAAKSAGRNCVVLYKDIKK